MEKFFDEKSTKDSDGFTFFTLNTTEDVIKYQKLQEQIKNIREEINTEYKTLSIINKRKETIKKFELNNKINKMNEQGGKFFVLQDENDLYLSYCFKTNIIDEFDDMFLESSDFDVFMDMMETNYASYAGVHGRIGGEKWFGFSSYEIKNFNIAIQMWYDFFKKHNKLTDNSEN
jgi:hypothetical protein